MSYLDLPPTSPSADRGWLVATAVSMAGFAVIGVAVIVGGVDRFDQSVSSQLATYRGRSTTAVARAVTVFGAFPVVLVAAAAAAIGLWAQTRQLRFSAILLTSVAATASIVFLLKIAIGRARPAVVNLVGTPSNDFAFPSGHTSNGTVVYWLATLLLTTNLRRTPWRTLILAAAAALTILIGLSRIYLGYHWPTDVLAGWLLAAGVTSAAYFASQRLIRGSRPELRSDGVNPAALRSAAPSPSGNRSASDG